MKRWTTVRLSLNNSILRTGISYAFVLWGAVTIPLVVITYNYNFSKKKEGVNKKRKLVQKTLTSLFDREARYGDYVNTRSKVLSLGKLNGLTDLILCRKNLEILPRFDRSECKELVNFSYITKSEALNNIDLFFVWEEPKATTNNLLLSSLIFSLCLSSFLIFGSVYFVIRKLSLDILNFSSSIQDLSHLSNFESFQTNFKELRPVISSLQKMARRVEKNEITKNENIILKKVAEVSNQVAHDIKSPLAALEIVMDDIKELPEDSRELTLNAIGRIQQIANDLSSESLETKGSVNLISFSTNSIIKEKRVEFINKKDLRINFTDLTNKENFISIDAAQWSRIISNLINNSSQAMGYKGSIDVSLEENPTGLKLFIKDDGAGFPEEILNNEIKRGHTVGKAEGQGLGLYHAYQSVKTIGGGIHLENDNGAIVEITIPIENPPKWFCKDINLKQKLVICDDDKSIHNLWGNVLRKNNIDPKDVIHVYDANELAQVQNINDYLILMDYDLRSKETGLELTKRFTYKNVVFVTSEYERDDLQKYCIENNLKILPKSLIESLIP